VLTVSDNNAHAIVVVDPQAIIRHWSTGAAELFGYSQSEAEGESLDLIMPDEFRTWHEAAYGRSMETGLTSVSGTATLNRPVKCRDGRVRPFLARLVFMKDPLDRTVGATMIFVSTAERPDSTGAHESADPA
jgi:PAS domain S-box-containing protein